LTNEQLSASEEKTSS